ncbi:MAG TPA: hypothetical protein PLN52_14725, partial [Opitutaceae bacterium]|nr:hypothetical protein [Opitutaceae bacterium]
MASLESFFVFHPWLFLFLIPAAGMRLWSEEKRTGTIELLFTLPVTTLEAVFGKFLAAWAFLGLAIGLSFPDYLRQVSLGGLLAVLAVVPLLPLLLPKVWAARVTLPETRPPVPIERPGFLILSLLVLL